MTGSRAGAPARLERSVLSVPAASRRMIEKAVASEADVVFLDLEDSVAPEAKAASRANAVWALRELDWGRKPSAYRVNGLDTPFFYRDLIEVVEGAGGRLSTVILPKVGKPEDLYAVETLLGGIEANMGLERGGMRLEAQIESAEGLVNVEGIARSGGRMEALIFGPGDFAASIRMPAVSIGAMDRWDRDYPGHRLHHAMSRILVAARAEGLRAVDGPLADYRDLDAFRRSCLLARSLGYDGKWCIHPAQIPIANEVFLPDEEEIAWAEKVVGAYHEALGAGQGVVSVDGTMVDMASIKMAQTTLDLARQAGIDSGERGEPR